jgi:dTDP-4-amino-4,6-dideoxygalactose transaminase
MKVPYSYLDRKYSDSSIRKRILGEIEESVLEGDFTLGKRIEMFERSFSELTGIKNSIAVSSGTTAIELGLRANNIGFNNKVITAPNTFYATVNAIAAVGAIPVFVDADETYNINPSLLEERLKLGDINAIMPVHLTGRPADMRKILPLSEKYGVVIVEDAAQAIDARIGGIHVGGRENKIAGFSMHPLKNLDVWGDAGIVTTNDDRKAEVVRQLRNQGLSDRDNWSRYGHNYRMDPLQAIVALNLMQNVHKWTDMRIANATYYDSNLSDINEVKIPKRDSDIREVFHTYVVQVERRDELQKYLQQNGIETKIHYPIPLHLQPAARHLGYKKGDFPEAEKQSERIITFPVHTWLKEEERKYVVQKVKEFYRG